MVLLTSNTPRGKASIQGAFRHKGFNTKHLTVRISLINKHPLQGPTLKLNPFVTQFVSICLKIKTTTNTMTKRRLEQSQKSSHITV